MKDEMKDIDQLFREKLGASSGKYDVGYWAKVLAMLPGLGASTLWRNARNASMLLLLAGVIAIDFFIPKDAAQYLPENTAIINSQTIEEDFEKSAEIFFTENHNETEEAIPSAIATESTRPVSTMEKKASNPATSQKFRNEPISENAVATIESELFNPEEAAVAIAEIEEPAVNIAEQSTEAEQEVEEVSAEEEATTKETAQQSNVASTEDEIDPLAAKDAARKLFVGGMAYGGSALRMVNSGNALLDNRKENEENPGLYYSSQVQVGYSFGNWSLITGFGQWTQKENLSYSNQLNGSMPVDNGYWDINTQSLITVDSNWVIAGIYQGYWNYDTTTVSYLDSTYITQWDTAFGAYDTTMAQNNGTHQLRYFEVPVMASYRLPLRKFDLEFSAGMSFGFFASSSGKTYLNSDQSAVLSSREQNALFRSPVYSALVGAGISYPLSRHWEIVAQAQARYTLNSVVNTTAWNQRYLQYGLGAGLRYRF